MVHMLAAIILFFTFLLFPEACADGVRNGLLLASEKALPALFPFFVASGLLVRTGLSSRLSKFAAKPLALFYGLPPETAPILILGLTGGYPVGAATASELVTQKSASPCDAARANLFCNCASPGFCVSLVGLGVFGSAKTGMILYVIHVLSALITGLCCAKKHNTGIPPCTPSTSTTNIESFPSAFCGAVTGAANTSLSVTAFLVMFSVLLSVIRPALVTLPMGTVFTGVIELTNGLLTLPPLPPSAKLTLVSFLLGFGGLAVHFQVRAIAGSCGLSVNGFTETKLLHGSIASVLTILLYRYAPQALETVSPISKIRVPTAPLWVFIILLSALAFFSGKRAGNRV